MAKGIDCAQPLTLEKAKALADAGYKFVARYLVPERYAWKRLTRAEAEAITTAGLQIVSVFETTANRPDGGSAAGSVDALLALQEAEIVGQPKGSAIYFAVDYDAQPKDYDVIEAYFRTAKASVESAGYRIGIYGSFSVVAEMDKRIPGLHVWQTYAWSRGAKYKDANIYQYKNGQTVAGHPVDLNESYGNEGWWDTKTKEDDDTLELTVTQRKMLVTALKDLHERGLFSDPTWIEKAEKGTLTVSELAWLNTIVLTRK